MHKIYEEVAVEASEYAKVVKLFREGVQKCLKAMPQSRQDAVKEFQGGDNHLLNIRKILKNEGVAIPKGERTSDVFLGFVKNNPLKNAAVLLLDCVVPKRLRHLLRQVGPAGKNELVKYYLDAIKCK